VEGYKALARTVSMAQPLTARNIVITLILAIPILAFVANLFFEGGIPAVGWFRDVVVIRATPLAAIASIAVMFKVYIINWARKSVPRIRIVIIFLTFAIMTIVGATLGLDSELYLAMFYQTSTVAGLSRYLLIAYSIASIMATYLRPRSIPHIVMIITQLLVFCSQSPIGEMIWIELTNAGKWLYDIPQIGAYNALWMGQYIGMAILVLMIIIGRERLRAAS
jgi:hypothetical protein